MLGRLSVVAPRPSASPPKCTPRRNATYAGEIGWLINPQYDVALLPGENEDEA